MVCTLVTVYYAYKCTAMYLSKPVSVKEEPVPLEDLPPLHWSVCKSVTFAKCTEDVVEYFFGLFFEAEEESPNETGNFFQNSLFNLN